MKKQKDFIWGCATSSYQIEGAWDKDGKGPSIWDTFCHQEGNIKNNDTGDVACDHYHRYAEDCDLISGLGVDAYRFSISWPRILPEGTGQINQSGLDFYDRLIDNLLEKNVTPWVTLYHWDLPQALEDKGGWANRDIVKWFEDYAQIFAEHFKGRVQNYVVLNEPSVTSNHGYNTGIFAPGKVDKDGWLKATHYQNLVNGKVIRNFRQLDPAIKAGSAYTIFSVHPMNPENEDDKHAAKVIDAAWTRNFIDPAFHGKYPDLFAADFAPLIKEGDMEIIQEKQDFIGINHYAPYKAFRDEASVYNATFSDQAVEGQEKTDFGWPIVPEDFKNVFHDLKDNYGNPVVYVLENGICDNAEKKSDGSVNDDMRISYYKRYTEAMQESMEEGCNVGGYFAWSFMDNFEWAAGYGMRFGLVHLNYETLERTPKKSYHWYRDMINSFKDKNDVVNYGT